MLLSWTILIIFFKFLLYYVIFSIYLFFFFSSRRRHTRSYGDWSSDVCSSDLGVTYTALVPNDKGYERAIEASLREIAVFTAATDTYNQRNIGTTIEGAFERYRKIGRASCRERVWV